MAGNWIKIEHSTPDKPEVYQLAELLEIDPNAALGALVRFWMWVDDQCESCNALTVTNVTLDRITTVTGFSAALQKVGWLTRDGATITVPNLERHNGQTAKNRATTSKRVAKHRVLCNGASVTNVTVQALPEKRREEKSIKTPKPPKGDFASLLNFEIEDQEIEKTPKPLNPVWVRMAKLVSPGNRRKFHPDEVKWIKMIDPPSEEEFELMEKFYFADFTPADAANYQFNRRTSLERLARHWNGELAKAHEYDRTHPNK